MSFYVLDIARLFWYNIEQVFEMSDNKMRVGLLWFDDDPRVDFSRKVQEAAQRYGEKFGRRPNVCYVNPDILPPEGTALDGIRVIPSPLVLPYYFWVGNQAKEED